MNKFLQGLSASRGNKDVLDTSSLEQRADETQEEYIKRLADFAGLNFKKPEKSVKKMIELPPSPPEQEVKLFTFREITEEPKVNQTKLGPIVLNWFPSTTQTIPEEEFETEAKYDISIFDDEAMNAMGFKIIKANPKSMRAGIEGLIKRMGGKSFLRDILVRMFPKCGCYVEPFGGSFKVILWKPYEDRIEIINDIDMDIVHFYRYVVFDPKGLTELINSIPMHEALILGMRDDLRNKRLHGLERAAAAYVSLRAGFNGMNEGYAVHPKTPMNIRIKPKDVMAVADRLREVHIRSTDFRRVISNANKPDIPGGAFFYLDPPYWDTAGYSTYSEGKSEFGWREQEELASCCWQIHNTGNKFLQTNSAHEDLRGLYGGFKKPDGSPAFHITEVDVTYTVAGAAQQEKEFIISNFSVNKAVMGQQRMF